MKRPTLRHRLEFLGYRLGLGLFGFLPEGVAHRLGAGMGWVAGVVLGVRRRTVREHLRLAFPDETEAWRRRVARASYRHLGRESVATFLLARMSREEVLGRTEVIGMPLLERALEEGKGAILVSAHLGNWEIAGASLALRGIPLEVVAQRQRNPLFDADLNENRDRLGMTVIPRGEAPRRVLRALRRGKLVAIVGDQNLRRGGVFVDFFGKPASTARGAALFALRARCPIFFGWVIREPGSPPRYRSQIVPVEYTPSGDMDEDIRRLTQLHTRYLEGEVVKAPEQYFWVHRRWKTQPPEGEG